MGEIFDFIQVLEVQIKSRKRSDYQFVWLYVVFAVFHFKSERHRVSAVCR